MIGFLRGILVAKQAPSLVIDVGGVGYEVDVPLSTFFKLPGIGDEVRLLTHLLIREDAHSLVGFLTEDERQLFRNLIRVSGIGAKLALGILSGTSAGDFQRSVQTGDTAALVRLPGIGKKTAERLVIELRDRLSAVETTPSLQVAGSPAAPADASREAVSALIALGFKPAEAEQMIRAVAADGRSSEDLIRAALQGAARK